jgi:hypothetical protein
MTREQIEAQIRAAAWAAVAALGFEAAHSILSKVREEITRTRWQEPTP